MYDMYAWSPLRFHEEPLIEVHIESDIPVSDTLTQEYIPHKKTSFLAEMLFSVPLQRLVLRSDKPQTGQYSHMVLFVFSEWCTVPSPYGPIFSDKGMTVEKVPMLHDSVESYASLPFLSESVYQEDSDVPAYELSQYPEPAHNTSFSDIHKPVFGENPSAETQYHCST
nr:hypothetical protein [Porcincola intestinalis]